MDTKLFFFLIFLLFYCVKQTKKAVQIWHFLIACKSRSVFRPPMFTCKGFGLVQTVTCRRWSSPMSAETCTFLILFFTTKHNNMSVWHNQAQWSDIIVAEMRHWWLKSVLFGGIETYKSGVIEALLTDKVESLLWVIKLATDGDLCSLKWVSVCVCVCFVPRLCRQVFFKHHIDQFITLWSLLTTLKGCLRVQTLVYLFTPAKYRLT